MPKANQRDVVELLMAQHEQIRTALDRVRDSRGSETRRRFADLVRLLAVHETAEEQVVHPALRHRLGESELIDARLHEEHEAKYLLSKLYELGVEHEAFDTEFRVFADKMVAHLECEESEEFDLVLREIPSDERAWIARAVIFAESLAPARDVPAEPPLVVFDRLRNGLREWRRQASIA